MKIQNDDMDGSLSSEIVDAVYKTYSLLPSNGKPKCGEFTVLAAVVIENVSMSTLEVVSIATGTKCLGHEVVKNDRMGCLISDSHAEVLARRCFKRYLFKSLISLMTNPQDDQSIILKRNDFIGQNIHHKPFGLKPCMRIHMFMTDAPCGDASIYECATETPQINYTGAKKSMTSTRDGSLLWEKETTQEIGVVRLKSGRSDIPSSGRTLSKSCSDKFSKWIFVGFAGCILLHLSSIRCLFL